MLGSFGRDMQRAWNRIHAVPTQRLPTRFGTVEYAERGEGLPILNCHGVLGCHTDGVDGWWTNMLGEGFRVISPSRFGYFGSTLQPTATPADQADTYAILLDHLGIDRAGILGYSAGSASVLEFGPRHPDRAIVLILASARLGGSSPSKLLKPVLAAVYGSDRLFWVYRALLPSIYGRMVGVPKGRQPTPGGLQTIRAVSELQFPLRPRRAGALFDGFVSNLVADRFPLERLTVPTLIVSAVDDHWAPYRYGAKAAERFPGAKLVTIDQGGHLFLIHDAQVRAAIAAFIASVTQPGGRKMSPRFAYLYFMRDDPDRIRANVANHISHWQQQDLPAYLGGPFEDRTGGLITFQAEDVEHARHAVDTDSSCRRGSWSPTAQAVDAQ